MTEFKIDQLKLGELSLTKSRHEPTKAETQPSKSNSFMDDEEILYWSSSSPKLQLSEEELNALAANPEPKPTKKGKN